MIFEDCCHKYLPADEAVAGIVNNHVDAAEGDKCRINDAVDGGPYQ